MIQAREAQGCWGEVGVAAVGGDLGAGELLQLQMPAHWQASQALAPSPGLPMHPRMDPPPGWGGQASPLSDFGEGAMERALVPPAVPELPSRDSDCVGELTAGSGEWRLQPRAGSYSTRSPSRSPKRAREDFGVLESPPVEDESGEPFGAPPARRARSSTWQSIPSSPSSERQDITALLEPSLSLEDALPASGARLGWDELKLAKSLQEAALWLAFGGIPGGKPERTRAKAGLSSPDGKRGAPASCGQRGEDTATEPEPEQELRAVPLEPVAPRPAGPVAAGAASRAAVEEEVRLAALELEGRAPEGLPPATVHASVAWPWTQSQFVREPVPALACETAAEVASAAFRLFQTRRAAQVRLVWLEGPSTAAGGQGVTPSGGGPDRSSVVPAVPFIQLNPFGAADVDVVVAKEVESQAFVTGKGGKRSRAKMCTVCGSAKSNLSRHLREHMGIVHVCAMPRCGRVFRGGVRGNLAPHAKEHLLSSA